MARRLFGHVRRQLVAYLALFFALSGGALAAAKVITVGSPAGGDLTGTYPNPTIAAGKVTNDKLANPSLTVTPGTGLTGGGSIALGGSGTLSVDPTAVQSRVSGTCSSGSAVSSINQDGSVGCQATGLTFTTGGGTTGPTLSQPGTYFVVAEIGVPSGADPVTGLCHVIYTFPLGGNTNFAGAFALPGGNAEAGFSFTGMLVVPSILQAGRAPGVECNDTAGNTVTPDAGKWWVSKVG